MKKLKIICALTAICLLCGCASGAEDLTKGLKAEKVDATEADADFLSAQADFSAELFKKIAIENENSNVHISPYSVSVALAMTANGAGENTRSELEALWNGIDTDSLNGYFLWLGNRLSSSEQLHSANSFWFNSGNALNVNKDFMQKTVNYYGAELFAAPFDESTQKHLNKWVKKNTDGMIREMEFSPDAVMCLVNAIAFDAKWQQPYEKGDSVETVFTNIDGSTSSVEMMYSDETVLIRDADATGFIKNYEGGRFGFAALLPKEETDIYDYINSLDGKKLQEIFSNRTEDTYVRTGIPKFTMDFSTDLVDTLSHMGVKDAFDRSAANLTPMATMGDINLFVGKVLHKTHITIDENGTRAAAATLVSVDCGSSVSPPTVILDRPFIFIIVDNATGLPVFMGVITNL